MMDQSVGKIAGLSSNNMVFSRRGMKCDPATKIYIYIYAASQLLAAATHPLYNVTVTIFKNDWVTMGTQNIENDAIW